MQRIQSVERLSKIKVLSKCISRFTYLHVRIEIEVKRSSSHNSGTSPSGGGLEVRTMAAGDLGDSHHTAQSAQASRRDCPCRGIQIKANAEIKCLCKDY